MRGPEAHVPNLPLFIEKLPYIYWIISPVGYREHPRLGCVRLQPNMLIGNAMVGCDDTATQPVQTLPVT